MKTYSLIKVIGDDGVSEVKTVDMAISKKAWLKRLADEHGHMIVTIEWTDENAQTLRL